MTPLGHLNEPYAFKENRLQNLGQVPSVTRQHPLKRIERIHVEPVQPGKDIDRGHIGYLESRAIRTSGPYAGLFPAAFRGISLTNSTRRGILKSASRSRQKSTISCSWQASRATMTALTTCFAEVALEHQPRPPPAPW